ncbi:MAG: MBL fold metallo-hydrolase [Dehalococcoidales bacterium]|nr:MBL fold metallo-hydrolase [Dehalococcoidales bacterium]
MKVQILGAHNIESESTGCISLLVDDVMAIDAGALTSSLSFPAQQKLKAVLLTHQHYDHTRDIPALGMNFFMHGNTIDVYSTAQVRDVLLEHLLNDSLYPNFMEKPPEKPSIKFNELKPGRAESIAGYKVLAVPVNHAVPTVGYEVTAPDGKKLFYTGDTGPGLEECWRRVSPDLLIIEVTALNKRAQFSMRSGHLTAEMLQKELESLRKLKGRLPQQIVTVHMNPLDEPEIKKELNTVAAALHTEIKLGREGMIIEF